VFFCACMLWNADQWGTVGFALPGCEAQVFKVDPDDITKKTPCPRAKDISAPTDAEQGKLCFRGLLNNAYTYQQLNSYRCIHEYIYIYNRYIHILVYVDVEFFFFFFF
jgi:hypothetical protein